MGAEHFEFKATLISFEIRADIGCSFNVVATVRNTDKGTKLLNAYPTNATGKLSYEIVEDVAQKGAFDEVRPSHELDARLLRSRTDKEQVVKSKPGFDFVIHTASPFHYNVQDPVKDFLEPAVTGTTSILKAIKDSAPSVKRVVITSSFAAINGGSTANPPFLDESCWNPITWDEAAQDTKKAYRGSKVSSICGINGCTYDTTTHYTSGNRAKSHIVSFLLTSYATRHSPNELLGILSKKKSLPSIWSPSIHHLRSAQPPRISCQVSSTA